MPVNSAPNLYNLPSVSLVIFRHLLQYKPRYFSPHSLISKHALNLIITVQWRLLQVPITCCEGLQLSISSFFNSFYMSKRISGTVILLCSCSWPPLCLLSQTWNTLNLLFEPWKNPTTLCKNVCIAIHISKLLHIVFIWLQVLILKKGGGRKRRHSYDNPGVN